MIGAFRIFLVVCLSSCWNLAQGEEESGLLDYTPAFSSQAVVPVNMVPCRILSGSGFLLQAGEATVARCVDQEVSLVGKTASDDPDGEVQHIRIKLTGKRTDSHAVEFTAQEFPGAFIDAASATDLNGDGKADFMLQLGSHGNGLAAEQGALLFLISQDDSYRVVALDGVMIGAGVRLMKFSGRPAAVLLLQRMASEGMHIKGSDGRTHLFFIFDLLRFTPDGSGLELANTLDPRFPFWTQMTERPSHAETHLLSDVKKKKLWHDPLRMALKRKMS
jgi:hypothetical protein